MKLEYVTDGESIKKALAPLNVTVETNERNVKRIVIGDLENPTLILTQTQYGDSITVQRPKLVTKFASIAKAKGEEIKREFDSEDDRENWKLGIHANLDSAAEFTDSEFQEVAK